MHDGDDRYASHAWLVGTGIATRASVRAHARVIARGQARMCVRVRGDRTGARERAGPRGSA